MVFFHQSPQNFPHAPQRASHVYYRNTVIAQLQSNHSIVMLVATNLSNYMKKARELARGMWDFRLGVNRSRDGGVPNSIYHISFSIIKQDLVSFVKEL